MSNLFVIGLLVVCIFLGAFVIYFSSLILNGKLKDIVKAYENKPEIMNRLNKDFSKYTAKDGKRYLFIGIFLIITSIMGMIMTYSV